MNDTFKQLTKFYNENKDKLQMPKAVNYPLNYKKGKTWAESQCDSDSRDFANKIISSTKYVSFDQFYKKLQLICDSYINTYSKKQHQGTKFVLILPFQLKKSNVWVTLLAFDKLRSLINEVYYNVTDVYNDIKNHRSRLYNKKVRCIICDDCAYTGNQLTYLATMDFQKLKYDEKPAEPNIHSSEWLKWYDAVQIGAKKIVDDISVESFSVDIVIPYMSTLAYSKLNKLHYIKIPDMSKIFPIFIQIVNMDAVHAHSINEFKRTFQYHSNISAIYFDHKIADSVSTFNKIYLLAPLFNCAVANQRIGFIDGCDEKTISPEIDIYNYYIDVEKETRAPLCPSSFYKHISYTFNNKILDMEMPISKLLANPAGTF